jgi:hypothetical protein
MALATVAQRETRLATFASAAVRGRGTRTTGRSDGSWWFSSGLVTDAAGSFLTFSSDSRVSRRYWPVDPVRMPASL